MSVITTVTDNLVSRIESVLTTHTRLHNPYALEGNSEQVLKKGYGIQIGAGVNTKREVGCSRYWIQRAVGLIITREALVRELDVASKYDVEQAILEDAILLQNSFENYRNLGSSSVVDFGFSDDTGIINVFVERRSFFGIQLNYQLEYFESIT